MGNAAKVENHNRVQRVLPLRIEYVVVNHLHQSIQPERGGHIQERRALPGKVLGPDDVGREKWRGGERIRPQQDAKREKSERNHLDRNAQFPIAFGRGEDRGGTEHPDDCEQNISPDDADQDECGRRKRENRHQDRKLRRTPRNCQRRQREAQPIKRHRQEQDASGARCDRIDERP